MERGKVIDWNGIQIRPSVEKSWDTTWRVSIYLYTPMYAGGFMLFSQRGIINEEDAIAIYNEQINAVIKSFRECLIKGTKKKPDTVETSYSTGEKNEGNEAVRLPEEADAGDGE